MLCRSQGFIGVQEHPSCHVPHAERRLILTTMSYIIVILCVLLAIAGLIWYALLIGKKDNEPSEEIFKEEKK